MFVVYSLLTLILTASAVASRAGTVVNIYDSDKKCHGDGSDRKTLTNSIVAFSVGRQAGFSPAKKSIIPMDHVFYNDGGYFDMKTSAFIAPISGLYAFYFGACGKAGKHVHLHLKVADKFVAATYNYITTTFNHASGSVYKKMKMGDQASVWLSAGHTINAHVPPSTHFNGHLMKEEA